MSRLAALARVAASVSALVLALAVFQGPLLKHLPATVADAASALPGLGASRGFLAEIVSVPAGAEVRIDGAVRGTTPFFGNVRCRAKQEVVIEVVAPGFEPWQRRVLCREGGTLRATARMSRP